MRHCCGDSKTKVQPDHYIQYIGIVGENYSLTFVFKYSSIGPCSLVNRLHVHLLNRRKTNPWMWKPLVFSLYSTLFLAGNHQKLWNLTPTGATFWLNVLCMIGMKLQFCPNLYMSTAKDVQNIFPDLERKPVVFQPLFFQQSLSVTKKNFSF